MVLLSRLYEFLTDAPTPGVYTLSDHYAALVRTVSTLLHGVAWLWSLQPLMALLHAVQWLWCFLPLATSVLAIALLAVYGFLLVCRFLLHVLWEHGDPQLFLSAEACLCSGFLQCVIEMSTFVVIGGSFAAVVLRCVPFLAYAVCFAVLTALTCAGAWSILLAVAPAYVWGFAAKEMVELVLQGRDLHL